MTLEPFQLHNNSNGRVGVVVTVSAGAKFHSYGLHMSTCVSAYLWMYHKQLHLCMYRKEVEWQRQCNSRELGMITTCNNTVEWFAGSFAHHLKETQHLVGEAGHASAGAGEQARLLSAHACS